MPHPPIVTPVNNYQNVVNQGFFLGMAASAFRSFEEFHNQRNSSSPRVAIAAHALSSILNVPLPHENSRLLQFGGYFTGKENAQIYAGPERGNTIIMFDAIEELKWKTKNSSAEVGRDARRSLITLEGIQAATGIDHKVLPATYLDNLGRAYDDYPFLFGKFKEVRDLRVSQTMRDAYKAATVDMP